MASTIHNIQSSQLTFCIIELRLDADLIESLDHPLVPVAEHVQPLHLPLPEHLWRHILSPGDTTEKKIGKIHVITLLIILDWKKHDYFTIK